MKLDIVTRQAWNTMVANLTASLSSWQAARKGELDATRATVAKQGAQAANLGLLAKQSGETAVSIAQQARAEALKLAIVDPRFVSTTTANPRNPTQAEYDAEGGANKSYIGSKLTTENAVQLLKYDGASGNWNPVGAPILARNQMDVGFDHAYAAATAALIRCPKTLSKLRAGLPVKILGIGSSTMAGQGASDPATKGFLPQLRDRLQELFPESVITIVNRGVGGRTLADLELETLTYAADQPDLTVITVGINDANQNNPPLADYRRRYEGFVRALMGYGSDVLAIDGQLWVGDTAKHKQYNREIQAAADAAGCGYWSRREWMNQVIRQGKHALYGDLVLNSDGLHHTDVGYAAFASAVAAALWVASGRTERLLSHRLPLSAMVCVPAPTTTTAYDPSSGHPQQSQHVSLGLTAGGTQRISVSWIGTGIRWSPVMSDAWPADATIRFRVDGGAWQAVGSPRLTTGGARVRGGMWTLAEGLPIALHLLEMEIIAGQSAATVYVAGFEAIYPDRFGVTYDAALVELYGPYAVLGGPALTLGSGLNTRIGDMPTPLLVNGARVWLDARTGMQYREATHAPGDATYDRIDAVLASQDGKLTVIAGTPAASPVAPALTLAGVLLAHVRVPAEATSNAGFVITDKRRVAAGVQQQAAPPALTAAPTKDDLNAWRTALIAAGVWR